VSAPTYTIPVVGCGIGARSGHPGADGRGVRNAVAGTTGTAGTAATTGTAASGFGETPQALPEKSYTIKLGPEESYAKYRIVSVKATLKLLEDLIKS
jgi:hypothetical protein